MSAVFLKLLNLSITASWLILAVILVRFLLKKAPKWILCVLWVIVAVRLVCPFSPKSVLSLIPSSETIPANIEMMPQPEIDSGITIINEAVNPVIEHSFTPNPGDSANPLQIIIPVLSVVWIAGMTTMLLYALISYIRLRKSVGASIPVNDNIFACDEVKSPFILGIIKPLIYVPSSMDGETLDYVITHETAHIQRHDHWWKPFGFLLLTVYWFNPLCWLAYVLLCRDIEMACDEKVIRKLDNNDKAAYSQALLNCSFPRRKISACPLAFGEVGVKDRIKSVLNYKKPAFWIVAVSLVACIVVAVCFLTNPKAAKDTVDESTPDEVTFEAQVLEIHDGYFLVAPEASWVLNSADRIEVPMMSMDPSPEPQVGDIIEITCNGEILETYPARLSKVYGIKVAKKASTVTKWFDCLNGDEMKWDGIREINLDEFSGVTFRWSYEKLEAVTDREIIPLYTGMPIWSVYFCDLNGDGKREICSTISMGSGMIDNRIIIFDYTCGANCEMSDRGEYDYILNMQNGKLIVEKRAYRQDELLDLGELVFRDETYQIIWDVGKGSESENVTILPNEVSIYSPTSGNICNLQGETAQLLSSAVVSDDWGTEMPALDPDYEITIGGNVYYSDNNFGVLVDAEKQRCLLLSDSDAAVISEAVATYFAAASPLLIVSNRNTVTPYRSFLWAQDWNDNGWINADGMGVWDMMPDIADELPVVTRGSDFELIYNNNASFNRLTVANENYEQLYNSSSPDQLDALSAGTYYVSIVVVERGEYIAEGNDYEFEGTECAFKLIVS